MPEKERQDRTLSELVVKEAVERGLETPMRETILEAVDEADAGSRRRQLPLVGAVFGLGAALGFLAGQQSSELETPSIEGVAESDVVEEVTEEVAEMEVTEEATETDEAESGSRRLTRLVLALGVIAGAVLLRRRMSGEEEDEWEPIEEFEPATDLEGDEEESEAEEATADTETGEESGTDADEEESEE